MAKRSVSQPQLGRDMTKRSVSQQEIWQNAAFRSRGRDMTKRGAVAVARQGYGRTRRCSRSRRYGKTQRVAAAAEI